MDIICHPMYLAPVSMYARLYAADRLLVDGDTPFVKQTALRLSHTKTGAVLETLVMAVLLLLCTAYLVDGSFSPFLYFRF